MLLAATVVLHNRLHFAPLLQNHGRLFFGQRSSTWVPVDPTPHFRISAHSGNVVAALPNMAVFWDTDVYMLSTTGVRGIPIPMTRYLKRCNLIKFNCKAGLPRWRHTGPDKWKCGSCLHSMTWVIFHLGRQQINMKVFNWMKVVKLLWKAQQLLGNQCPTSGQDYRHPQGPLTIRFHILKRH